MYVLLAINYRLTSFQAGQSALKWAGRFIIGSVVYNRAVTYTVCVKKNATICTICAPLFDKKSHCIFMVCLWICEGSAVLFAQMHHNSVKALHFHGKSTRRRTVARPSKCSAFGGRKMVHMAPFFKCRCGTFVAFFLTRTIYTYICSVRMLNLSS